MDEPVEVFRDKWLLAVDKPFGMPTQTRADGKGQDLFSWVRERNPGAALHHRLDQPASGLVLFGLHPDVNRALTEGFRAHTIERRYKVVLSGDGRNATWTWPVDGKAAEGSFITVGRDNGMTAGVVKLETGRKHQIRIHAAMAGTPVIGDKRYGGEAGRIWPRLALHAAELKLVHPITDRDLTLRSAVPADLEAIWLAAGGS
ncbi:MAG: RluA family pseudouridine synthase [Proteobacteria bacterium]|nr:RluA family pseudouridine synthase [Pseudomonadota bacterium]